jgi:hypothetical protein
MKGQSELGMGKRQSTGRPIGAVGPLEEGRVIKQAFRGAEGFSHKFPCPEWNMFVAK